MQNPQPTDPPGTPATAAAAPPGDRAFFGHPAGLLTLFFAEMWERFSYYGMRAILTLFMTATTVQGGLELSKERAGVIYGLYTSMVFLAGLPGGWLADNVLGQRRSVFWGGVVIMFGHISLAFHGLPCFYAGLLLIIAGTGLLKPNISTIVGLLYGPKDVRRDSGFAIYYMGINLGSFGGQMLCGFLAQHSWFKEKVLAPMGIEPTASWHWAFAAAAVGMFLGLVVFVFQGRLMREAGLHPVPPRDDAERRRRKRITFSLAAGAVLFLAAIGGAYASGMDVEPKTVNFVFGTVLLAITLFSFGRIILASDFTVDERKKLLVVFILFIASVLFWAAFEQAGGALNLFANEKSQLAVGGIEIPSSWYQNINPFGIIVLSPFFAFLWLRLGTRAPSSPAKFSIGLLLVGLGFVVAALGSSVYDESQQRISPLWLTTVYLLHTLGELCLSPIGLSMVTKLAPQRAVSQVMSIWFLANANAGFLAAQTLVYQEEYAIVEGKLTLVREGLSATQTFWIITAVTIGAGILLAFLTRPIKRMMGGVH